MTLIVSRKILGCGYERVDQIAQFSLFGIVVWSWIGYAKPHGAIEKHFISTIRDSLANAKENGHDFADYTDEDVAGDMIAYDDSFSHWTREELAPYVKAARNAKN